MRYNTVNYTNESSGNTYFGGLANPSSDIRSGAITAALFFLGFIGWASFARLDAAAYAPGTLVVSGEHQSVQHRDGGLVRKLYVHEGERVVRGQLLITLAAAEVRAQERALASQAIRLLAQRARLEAEQLGRSVMVAPQEFSGLAPEDRVEAATAMKLQQTELAVRASVLTAQRDALGQRVAQSDEQGRGYDEQATSAGEQLRLINEQIASLKPLAEKGFVSQSRMRDLERTRAELIGQRGQYSASVAQSRGVTRENEIQKLEAQQTFRERSASDLREVENSVGEVLPKWEAAREQLERTEIRAPATGAIVGLSIFTPGGVIAPGQKLMDIVPENTPLRIQIRIDPDDVDDITLGQKVSVKFSGLHERNMPNIDGKLTRVSADILKNEKGDQSFYTGDVLVKPKQLQIIWKYRDKYFELRPGMPVQVLIPLRKRTALDYALEPLIGSFWTSFREH